MASGKRVENNFSVIRELFPVQRPNSVEEFKVGNRQPKEYMEIHPGPKGIKRKQGISADVRRIV